MNKWLMVLAIVALSGCTSTGNRSSNDANLSGSDQTTTTADLARLRTELAAQYFSTGNFGVALSEATGALEANSSYAPAHNVLGLIYMELKETAKAEASFQRAISLAPSDPEVNNNFGWFLCENGRAAASIDYFLKAVSHPLYSTRELAFANAGECAFRAGDVTRAKDFLERSVRTSPTQPKAMRYLAEIAYQNKEYLQAKQFLIAYSRLAAHSAQTLWLGVRAAKAAGDREEMASFATQLLKNFPSSQEAALHRAGRFD